MHNYINIALLKEQLKRYWAVSALSLLGYFLFMILPLISSHHPMAAPRMIAQILAMTNPMVVISIVLVPFVAVMCVTGQFFKARMATAFYSYPINKTQMHLSNALAGIILTLVPLVIISVILLVPVHVPLTQHLSIHNPYFSTRILAGSLANPPLHVFSFFLRVAIAKIFYFNLFWLMFSVAGNRVVAILVSIVTPFIPWGIYMLGIAIREFYVLGSRVALSGRAVEVALSYSNPVLWSTLTHGRPLIHLYLWYAAAAILLGVAALVVSRIRKVERTGDSIIFHPVKNVLIFLVSLFSAVIGSLLFMGLFSFGPVSYYLGFVLGFALGFVIAQMIAEKSFSVGDKLKSIVRFGVIALAMYIVILLVTQLAVVNYLSPRFIPAHEDIAEIHLASWVPPNPAHRGRYGGPQPLTDAASIAQARDIHRQILENSPTITAPWVERNWRYTIHFVYVLHDGSEVWRAYQNITRDFYTGSGIIELKEQAGVRVTGGSFR